MSGYGFDVHKMRPGDLIRFRPRGMFDGAQSDTYIISHEGGWHEVIHADDTCLVLGVKWYAGDPNRSTGACDVVVFVNGRVTTVDGWSFDLIP